MTLYIAAFTGEGVELGAQVARAFPESRLFAPERYTRPGVEALGSLNEWTRDAFEKADGLLFVGACGIAVRAVAPFLRGKDRDPAVVAVDQKGRFAVALLSGHLGGANRLAREAAAVCGGTPVITTGTDVCGVFAVDEWAAEHNAAVLDVGLIKEISGRLLAGKPVGLSCDFSMDAPPDGFAAGMVQAGVSISLDADKRPYPLTLRLVPRIVYLGMGCRKNTAMEILEEQALLALREAGICIPALAAVCTIDLKAKEPGLVAFCEKYALPLRVFSSAELMALEGEFSGSAFVAEVTGADNVCERAAMAGCGAGKLLCRKRAGNGVTVAIAVGDWKAVFHATGKSG